METLSQDMHTAFVELSNKLTMIQRQLASLQACIYSVTTDQYMLHDEKEITRKQIAAAPVIILTLADNAHENVEENEAGLKIMMAKWKSSDKCRNNFISNARKSPEIQQQLEAYANDKMEEHLAARFRIRNRTMELNIDTIDSLSRVHESVVTKPLNIHAPIGPSLQPGIPNDPGGNSPRAC